MSNNEAQPGDIVRNADDDSDLRAWSYADPDDDRECGQPWLLVTADKETGVTRWCGRDTLPANLRLLVRGGHPVADRAERHPQPGDVVNEEPPVGSVVRDNGDHQWTRRSTGWGISSAGSSRYDCRWSGHVDNYGPLTLLHWGVEQ